MPDLKSIVLENPMLVEAKRFGRKFLGVSRGNTLSRGILVLSCFIYLMLVMVTFSNRTSMNSDYIIQFQTGLLCFVVPTITYGAVAGERERRTWDLLIVAPISKLQIIIGKFVSGLIVICSVALLMVPLIFILAVSNGDRFMAVMSGEAASLGFATAFSACGLYVSSLMNRAFAAQAATYAVGLVWLVLWPMLVYLLNGSGDSVGYLLWSQPFITTAAVADRVYNIVSTGNVPWWLYSPGAQIVFYGLVTSVFLLLATIQIQEKKNRAVRGVGVA